MARSDSGVQASWYILTTAEGAFDRQIVARRTFHGVDRNATARTVIVNEVFMLTFSRDAETGVLNFTRTHFPIVAPVNPLLQFKPCQVQDRTVLLRF
jgi:hypothetical protein